MSEVNEVLSNFRNAQRELRDFCDVNTAIDHTRKTLETLEKMSERARVLGQTMLEAPEGYFLEITAMPYMGSPTRTEGIYFSGENICWGDSHPNIANPLTLQVTEPLKFQASKLQVSWRNIIAVGINAIVEDRPFRPEYPARTVEEFDTVKLIPLSEISAKK